MKSKFLVLYPNPSNLDAIIKKANAQHAKNGPFLAIILLGCSLPAEAPATSPDAPTYFFGSSEQNGRFVDIAPNFTCVNSRTAILKLASGVVLAFLNDTLTADSDSELPVKADVLFSYNWPYCIAADQRLTLVGDRSVDAIVKQLQPRYHFANGLEMGKVHEHSVLAWGPKRSYRFISLAREGTGNKWFYAFAIDLGDDDISGSSVNPFLEEKVKRLREEEEDGVTSKQQKLDLSHEHEEHGFKPIKVVAPSECFFCLSNPNLESHMIVSIAKHSYLTVAKGPLTTPTRALNFSGHAIIIPIDHTPLLPDTVDVKQEIEQYMQTLADAFARNGYDIVCYEISRPENVHFHIQLVPVPRGLIGKLFEKALEDKSCINNETFQQNSKLHFKKYAADDQEVTDLSKKTRFIKFTVYSERKKTYYITSLEEGKGLDLQFPRRVLAYILRLPKRVKWDRCRQSSGQETTECQKFKQFYEDFDFTK